jgi:hypothetical protein
MRQRYKPFFKENWITVKLKDYLTEELRLSDFQKHAGNSEFTAAWRKDRQKIKGTGNRSAKLVKMAINKRKDYIKFFWLSEPTYSFDTKVTQPKSMKLVKDNLYTQIVMCQDIFKLLRTQPKFKTYQDITIEEIKDAIKSCTVKVNCDCPSQWWQGFSYYLTILDGAVYPCDIEPTSGKHGWKDKHNAGDGLICKHLDLILGQSISFYIPIMAGMIYKYLNNNNQK